MKRCLVLFVVAGWFYFGWALAAEAQTPSTFPTSGVLTNVSVQADHGVEGGFWFEPNVPLAGDFDGNGFTDVAYVFKDGDRVSIDVFLSHPNATGADVLTHERWATQRGQWLPIMSATAGDFDGDGVTDIALEFSDFGLVAIDVFKSNGSLAAGGFAPQQRWENHLVGWVNDSVWLAGDFDGDGFSDLAYVFSDGGQTSVDVHRSGGNPANGFMPQRWSTRRGDWVDLAMSDPSEGLFTRDPAYTHCTACVRQAQWVAGDFNGDGTTDIGFAFNGGSGANIDLRLSNKTGFTLQRAATAQGGWLGECFWVAADMNGDGRDDMVNIFDNTDSSLSESFDANVDVHLSNIDFGSFNVDPSTAFLHQRWGSLLADSYWNPGPASAPSSLFGSTVWITGRMLGGVFRNWDGKADIMVVHVANDDGGPLNFNLFGTPSQFPPPSYIPWSPVLGTAVDIGSGWALSTRLANGDATISEWDPALHDWMLQPSGAARTITVDLNGLPWIIDHTGQIYQGVRNGPDPYGVFDFSTWTWQPYGTLLPASLVAVGVTNCDYNPYGVPGCHFETFAIRSTDNSIWQFTTPGWVQLQPGAAATKIAVVSTPDPNCGDHLPIVIGTDGLVYRWVRTGSCIREGVGSGSFQPMSVSVHISLLGWVTIGSFAAVDISTDFAVGADGMIYQWDPKSSIWQPFNQAPFGTNTRLGAWTNGLFAMSTVDGSLRQADYSWWR